MAFKLEVEKIKIKSLMEVEEMSGHLISIDINKMRREKTLIGNLIQENYEYSLTDEQIQKYYFSLDAGCTIPHPGIDFNTYKKIHENDVNARERLVAHITSVTPICEHIYEKDKIHKINRKTNKIKELGYQITFTDRDGTKITRKVGFNNTLAKENEPLSVYDHKTTYNKKVQRVRGIIRLLKPQVTINKMFNGVNTYDQINISPEFLIGICRCFISDRFYLSFKNMVVNIKSGCGNQVTREILGIKNDLRPANLEWVTASQNAEHGKCLKIFKKRTGVAYEISACNTEEFNSPKEILLSFLDNKELKKYCDNTFKRAKVMKLEDYLD